MKDMPQLTPQTVEVLRHLLMTPSEAQYGREIGQATGLKTGTLHPILARLERAGLVESYWEEPREHEDAGRPRRRYYRFTTNGADTARLALASAHRTASSGLVRLRPQSSH